MVEPLGSPAQIGAGNPREALAIADVGARAVDRAEDRLEQLVPDFEGGLEGEMRIGSDQRSEHLLLDVGRLRLVQRAHAIQVDDDGRCAPHVEHEQRCGEA